MKPITKLPTKGLAFIPSGEFDALKPSLDFIPGMFCDNSVALVWGPSQSGKTFFAIHALCCAATGRQMFGMDVERRRGLYVGLEGEANVKARIQAWCAMNGVAEDSNPIDYALGRFTLTSDEGEDSDVAKLIDYMQDRKIRFVIIDTLAMAMTGYDEISGQHMSWVIDALHHIKRATGACVVAIDHTGKNIKAGERGHSSKRGNVDTSIEIQVHNIERRMLGNRVQVVEHDITPDMRRTAYVKKQRDMEGAGVARWSFGLTTKVTPTVNARGDFVKSLAVDESCDRFKDLTADGAELTAEINAGAVAAVALSEREREAQDVLRDEMNRRRERYGSPDMTPEQFRRALVKAGWGPSKPASWRSAWLRLRERLTVRDDGIIVELGTPNNGGIHGDPSPH